MEKKQEILAEEKITAVSLSHYLSAAGVASRRKCTEMVKAGMITVNGAIVTEPGFKVNHMVQVSCNGKDIKPTAGRIYIMLNKPPGYVCSSSDPYASKLALDLVNIPDARLFSAGRLDCDSEGLLIITNDGIYADKLTHPRYEVCKTYHALVNEPIAETELQRLRAGIIDDGEKLKPESIECIGKCQYRLILNEGKKREIRRLLGAAGRDTIQLQRVAIGKLLLGNLPVGSWRHLTPDEVDLSMITDIKR